VRPLRPEKAVDLEQREEERHGKESPGRWMEAWEEIPLPCLHKGNDAGGKTEVP